MYTLRSVQLTEEGGVTMNMRIALRLVVCEGPERRVPEKRGLFATFDIPADTIILLAEDGASAHQYNDIAYDMRLLTPSNGVAIMSGISQLANTSPDPTDHNACFFTVTIPDRQRPFIVLASTRAIKAGQQVVALYSPSYDVKGFQRITP